MMVASTTALHTVAPKRDCQLERILQRWDYLSTSQQDSMVQKSEIYRGMNALFRGKSGRLRLAVAMSVLVMFAVFGLAYDRPVVALVTGVGLGLLTGYVLMRL